MPTWLWIFILVFVTHVILAFIASPPTFLVDKFVEMFTLHPKLREESISHIVVNDVEITGEAKTRFVQEFNNINFLFEGGFERQYNERPFRIQIKQGKSNFVFTVYNYGNQLEFIRHKKKEYRPYRAKSVRFQRVLSDLIID